MIMDKGWCRVYTVIHYNSVHPGFPSHSGLVHLETAWSHKDWMSWAPFNSAISWAAQDLAGALSHPACDYGDLR